MKSDEQWAIMGRAVRGRRRRGEDGRARARRAGPSIDEIRALRSPIDLAHDDGTEGARAFRRIQGRMAEQLGPLSDATVYRDGECVLTRSFRARRAEVGRAVTRARLAAPRHDGAGSGPRSPASKGSRVSRELSAGEIRKIQKRRRELNLPALHEAGHAVVAHRLGLEVSRTSISGERGETHVTVAEHDERWLPVLLAGLRGEQLHQQWDDQFMDLWPLHDDYREIEAHFAALDPSAEDELALRLRAVGQVDEILGRYADDHFELTRVLVRERTVSGSELQRILSGGGR